MEGSSRIIVAINNVRDDSPRSLPSRAIYIPLDLALGPAKPGGIRGGDGETKGEREKRRPY